MTALSAQRFRLGVSAPTAFLVTAALFLTMRVLVAPPNHVVKTERASASIDLGRIERDEAPNRDRTRPEKPEFLTPPERRMEQTLREAVKLNPNPVRLNDDSFVLPTDKDTRVLVMPKLTMRIPPSYPARAEARGIEGYAVVCFDLTAQGEPTRLQVTESSPTGYFETASTDAVARWRYAPSIVGGRPVPRENICTRLTYQLGD